MEDSDAANFMILVINLLVNHFGRHYDNIAVIADFVTIILAHPAFRDYLTKAACKAGFITTGTMGLGW
jgi:hypothetical protein